MEPSDKRRPAAHPCTLLLAISKHLGAVTVPVGESYTPAFAVVETSDLPQATWQLFPPTSAPAYGYMADAADASPTSTHLTAASNRTALNPPEALSFVMPTAAFPLPSSSPAQPPTHLPAGGPELSHHCPSPPPPPASRRAQRSAGSRGARPGVRQRHSAHEHIRIRPAHVSTVRIGMGGVSGW